MQYSRADLLALQFANGPSSVRTVRRRLFRYHLVSPASFSVVWSGKISQLFRDPNLSFKYSGSRALNINCRSIANKSATLVECISSHSFDVFRAVETWHTSSEDLSLNNVKPAGFSWIEASRSSTSSQKKTGWGCGSLLQK